MNTGAGGQRFGGYGCVGTVPRQRSGNRREGQGFQTELGVLVYGRLKEALHANKKLEQLSPEGQR